MGFGAMRVTGRGVLGEPSDREEAKAVLRRAVALGVNLIDTADSYGPAVSERLIAEALHPYPAGLVIATKGGFLRSRGGGWQPDGRPAHLREALAGSLRRLRVDRIDLYQLHTVDPNVPLEESLGALVDAQAQGKIRHIGVSNVDAAQLAVSRRVARVVSVQNRYSLSDRASDPVLDACEREGLGFLPWRPLAAGALAGARVKRAQEIARRHGASSSQVALAWLLRRSPAMIPIPGTSSVAHLEENVRAAGIHLTDEEFAALQS
jgi:aryl-alcohol dehydrogenase-like predicted oxidoreductase